MSIWERLYRTRLGRVMSFVANGVARVHKPFMVYGYFDYPSRTFLKYTRMSSTVTIIGRKTLSIGDHVWVGHYSVLDATNHLHISEGCQIAAWVAIFTHGSHNAIRLLGREYVHIPNTDRKGYIREKVEIGPYTFIGTGSIILPGVKIGKGCLVGVGTLVRQDVPDYSIILGFPGRITGSTIDLDRKQFGEQDFSETYYDREAFGLIARGFGNRIHV